MERLYISSSNRNEEVSTIIVSLECSKIDCTDVALRVGQITEYLADASVPDWKADAVIGACSSACHSLNFHPSEHIEWKLFHLADAYRQPVH